MRTHSYCRMIVDGRATAELEVFRENNAFHVFEHDENVFSGGYTGALEFIKAWMAKWQDMMELLKESGHAATWEQTIR